MDRIDIRDWVERTPERRDFRQAVHTILMAISGTPRLRTSMIMKGGILLALGYASDRYTKDIDFSTSVRLQEFDVDDFLRAFDRSLTWAVNHLEYGLDCLVQGCKQQPPKGDATFPTLQIKVGYAYKSDTRSHKRLRAKQSSRTIQIDYSLNEPMGETEFFEIDEGLAVQTYSFADLVAEKFRALLQQKVRNRIRRQDIYDLYFVLSTHPLRDDPATRARILGSLLEKAGARGLAVGPDSMADPEIIRRSQAEYQNLAAEIEGELPDFDLAYGNVRAFYEALPWKE